MTLMIAIVRIAMIVQILSSIKAFFMALYRLDKIIVVTLFCLAGINILVQYSANDKMMNRLISDIGYLGVSFVILFIIANLNISAIKHLAIPIYLLSIALLIAVLLFGIKLHGAQRWLNIGMRIQPS